jgi:hypothetical protein
LNQSSVQASACPACRFRPRFLIAPVWFRDASAPGWRGTVRALAQVALKLSQKPLNPVHLLHGIRPPDTGSRRRHETRYDRLRPAGVIGPGRPGHALTLTFSGGVIKLRALPSRRVMLHADHRYYGPLGLPLPSRRFHHRLIPLVLVRRRPGRRPLLFRPRLCARAALRTPGGPGRLTLEQGPPGMAFAVK